MHNNNGLIILGRRSTVSFFWVFICKMVLTCYWWFPDRSKLADPFYRLEHQEADLKKKKEADPVLVRLQRISDARRSDDYALNKALRTKLRVCYLANVCSFSSSLFLFSSSSSSSSVTSLYLPSFSHFRVKRKELLKKRLLPGKLDLALDYCHPLKKILLLQLVSGSPLSLIEIGRRNEHW